MENLYLQKEHFEQVFKRHLKSSVYSLSIRTLFGERMTRKVKYDPYYQRNYVWDQLKATFFIESILLGTDIPPLIFFNAGKIIEVIDGRQRYETIKRFRNGELKLNVNGLTKLQQLKGQTFSQLPSEVQDIFSEAKIRIFEFEVINEPKLDLVLEDKIKKEIFRRYNSGITPLNTAEIDNATYDEDEVTNKLKLQLSENAQLVELLKDYFMARKTGDESTMLQFLRKYLIMTQFPINTYATGSNRTEIFDLLYSVKSSETNDADELCNSLFENLKITVHLLNSFSDSSIKSNRLINECLLWVVNVLVSEEQSVELLFEPMNIKKIEKYLLSNERDFLAENSHHYMSIITRFRSVKQIVESIYNIDLTIYLRDDDFRRKVKEIRQSEDEVKLKIDELSSLRVQKPEPSLIPVEEMMAELGGNRFLVRPSYQRKEKINVVKASAIIESILLGINLPPIFLYKNKSGVKEVIDGQQRLLSILGFIGKKYLDQNSKLVFPKNINYKLNRLKILSELNGKSYSSLEFEQQDRIQDFKLSVIEIDSSLNEHFEPVDLFIRLNNKPYPIKENSFEMWNSFMDRETIERIRSIADENIGWFFIKKRAEDRSLDRMLNEELITLLAYINYNSSQRPDFKALGFYLRDGKINCRISDKKDVSTLLENVSTDVNLKRKFRSSLDVIARHISQIKLKLDQENLRESLTALFSTDPTTGRRLLVDFYLLFELLRRFDDTTFSRTSFEDLQGYLRNVQDEIKAPSTINPEISYERYFSVLFDKLVQGQNQ